MYVCMYEYLFVTCFGWFSSEILLAHHCDYSLVSTTYINTNNKLKVLFCKYEHTTTYAAHLLQECVFMYVSMHIYVQYIRLSKKGTAEINALFNAMHIHPRRMRRSSAASPGDLHHHLHPRQQCPAETSLH